MSIYVYIQHTKCMVQTDGVFFCMLWCNVLISERRKEERVFIFVGQHTAQTNMKNSLILSINQPERNELKLGNLQSDGVLLGNCVYVGVLVYQAGEEALVRCYRLLVVVVQRKRSVVSHSFHFGPATI